MPATHSQDMSNSDTGLEYKNMFLEDEVWCLAGSLVAVQNFPPFLRVLVSVRIWRYGDVDDEDALVSHPLLFGMSHRLHFYPVYSRGVQ